MTTSPIVTPDVEPVEPLEPPKPLDPLCPEEPEIRIPRKAVLPT